MLRKHGRDVLVPLSERTALSCGAARHNTRLGFSVLVGKFVKVVSLFIGCLTGGSGSVHKALTLCTDAAAFISADQRTNLYLYMYYNYCEFIIVQTRKYFLNDRPDVGSSLVPSDHIYISGLIGNYTDQCFVRIVQIKLDHYFAKF